MEPNRTVSWGDTSLRCFGVISSAGSVGTLHFRPRSTQLNLRIAEPNQISVCLEILLFIWMCWASLFYRLFVGFTPKSCGAGYETVEPNQDSILKVVSKCVGLLRFGAFSS